jgi:hypothetical protein
MRPTARLTVLALSLAALAACTASAGRTSSSPTAAPPSAPSAEPVSTDSPGASSGTGSQSPWLRAWTTQALPPLSVFAISDLLVVTGDGVAVEPAPPVPTVAPGPAVMPLTGRQLTDEGRRQILERAQALGLLSGQTDFGSAAMPGAATAHVTLTLDGNQTTISGPVNATVACLEASCSPAPGSPEAFGAFWADLANLSWLGAEAGPAAPYSPPVYSVLVGAPPALSRPTGSSVAVWPLATPIASFGVSVANGTARCGTVTDGEADQLRPALETANAQTQWVQRPGAKAAYGLTVRPLVDGQDACREVFGVG